MLKLKQKLKKKFRSFIAVCQETAELINGKYQDMTHKMWEVGEIITKKREEINPKYGDQFLAGIAERMESQPTVKHLGECERFYSRYTDLLTRVSKSHLKPSHYQLLARIPEPEEREKLEKITIKQKLSTVKLREKIYPKLPSRPEKKTPKDWVNMIIDKSLEMRTWLSEPKVIPYLSIEDRNKLTESLEELMDRIDNFLEKLKAMKR